MEILLFIFPVVVIMFGILFQFGKSRGIMQNDNSKRKELEIKRQELIREHSLKKIEKFKEAEKLLDTLSDEEISKKLNLKLSDIKKIRDDKNLN
ncbi:MAG: hypothetical protein R3Y64_04460 [Peptostreptococcaceae bacterium]